MEDALQTKSRRLLGGNLNPVLVKELRGRMRGARAFTVLTVHLLLLSCFTLFIYYAHTESTDPPGTWTAMSELGKIIFASVVLIEIFAVTFVTPAFTAGAICGERERQTYALLRTTLLPARKLVYGKLLPTLTYMSLLILAALPLKGLAFVMGGVTVEEFILVLVFLAVTTLFFATLGLFFSSLVRTTRASTVLSNVTALLLTVGLPVLMLILVALTAPNVTSSWLTDDSSLSWRSEVILACLVVFVASLSPLSTAVATKLILEDNAIFYFWYELTASSTPIQRIPLPSPWIIYVVLWTATAFILLAITIARVRRPER
ncbi:MAG: ABC transporter permease [Anaerolineae bacterium]|nr:ABC transporter permease [Anaerolineae bacterium]